MSDGMPYLSLRLNQLFTSVPRPDGQLHTLESVVEGLRERGINTTANYLSQMRCGRRTNPSAVLLKGIADVFGVPMDFFFTGKKAKQIQLEIRALAELRSSGVHHLAMRAQGVSSENLQALLLVLEKIRQMEGLDPYAPNEQENS